MKGFDKIMGGGLALVGAVILGVMLSSAVGQMPQYEDMLNVDTEAEWQNYKSLDTGLQVDNGTLQFTSSGSGSATYTSEDFAYNTNITQLVVDGAVYDADNSSISSATVTVYDGTDASIDSVSASNLDSGSTVVDLTSLQDLSNGDHVDVSITLQRDDTSISSPQVDAHITSATGGDSLIASYVVPLFLLGALIGVVYGIYRSFT